MKLYLINDLPLFGVQDGPAWEGLVREEIHRLRPVIPSTLTYLDFEEVQRLWASGVASSSGVLVLVGTRPPLLYARWPTNSTDPPVVAAKTARDLDSLGHTDSVVVTLDVAPPWLITAEELCIVDDVAMSGNTLHAVLGTLRQAGVCGSVTVQTMIATSRALKKVRASGLATDVHAEVVLDFVPIEQGTVIFLSDLLYGTLRGRPFLSQTELLRPFFGGDLSVLRRLRDVVGGMG